jgi:hypothetical protein
MVWLSINLVDSDKKQPIFAPYITTEIGGLKVAILGITDEQAEYDTATDTATEEGEYSILPWQDTLPQVVAEADKKADMIILLSNYPYQVNKEIAESVEGVHLILASGHAASSADPYKVKNTLIAQTKTRGKYLGMMQIDWTEAKQWREESFSRIRTEQDRLDRINWQLGRMEKREDKDKLSKNKRYLKMQKDSKALIKKIAKLKESREKAPETKKMCGFTNRFIALDSSLPEASEVKKIIDQTVKEVNLLNKKRIGTMDNQQTATLQDLAGWLECQKCHQKQVTFWQKTGHARAWPTLEKKNQQFNEECLLCHVTLPYYDADKLKAGSLLLMLPKKLKNVGCEACHGPAKKHSGNQEAIPVPKPDEKTCKVCHTPDHDDNFVFADKVERIRCPKNDATEN